MNVLFLGNSLLGSLFDFYKSQLLSDTLLKYNCSFAMEIGGWGPGFKIIDDRLLLSSKATSGEIRSLVFPENLLNIPVSSFDAIVIVGVGAIGGGIGSSRSLCSFGKIYEFQPKVFDDEDLPPLTKFEFEKMASGFLAVQEGVRLVKSLRYFSSKKIMVEQPYLSNDIQDNHDWIISKIYHDPISAYRFFCSVRRRYLLDLAFNSEFELVPAMFDDLGFTPREFVRHGDFFHTNSNHSELLFSKIIDLMHCR